MIAPLVAFLLAAGNPPRGMVFLPAALVQTGCWPPIHKTTVLMPPPVTTKNVRGFFLDRAEVTVAAYRACVTAGACATPETRFHLSNFHLPDREDHPVTAIRWADADAYCRWAGKHLPSEAEWDRAAQGPSLNLDPFVWGDSAPDCSRVAGVSAVEGAPQDLCLTGYLQPRTLPVCSRPQGNSKEGICDLAGNAAEWVADVFVPRFEPPPSDELYWKDQKCEGSEDCRYGRRHVFKGGAGRYSSASFRERRACIGPQNHSYLDLGVRCAKDVTAPAK